MPSYIYLVKWSDGVKKVGRTTQEVCAYFIDRLRAYKKCTLVCVCTVSTFFVKQIESEIIAEFNKTFTLSHGLEYFDGDVLAMQVIVYQIVSKYIHINDPVTPYTEVYKEASANVVNALDALYALDEATRASSSSSSTHEPALAPQTSIISISRPPKTLYCFESDYESMIDAKDIVTKLLEFIRKKHFDPESP